MVENQVVSEMGRYGMQLMIGQSGVQLFGCAVSAEKRVSRISHSVVFENRFQAPFVKRAIMGNQRKAMQFRGNLHPNLREARGLCGIGVGDTVYLCSKIGIIVGNGADKGVELAGYLSVSYHHYPNATYAGALPVSCFKINCCKILHIGMFKILCKDRYKCLTFVGMNTIKVIAFDADDTLWVNEPYFREAEHTFCKWMERFGAEEQLSARLFEVEMKNLHDYGYGAKAFTLSLMETALLLSREGEAHGIAPVTPDEMHRVLEIGTSLIRIPIELLDGIKEVLEKLSGKYMLVVATKGDLLDQQRKLERSGLLPYFHHVEIMSDKKRGDYGALLKNLNLAPEEFLMIGNSLKSDVLPVLELGGYGVHIPFRITWVHEAVEEKVDHPHFFEIEHPEQLMAILLPPSLA